MRAYHKLTARRKEEEREEEKEKTSVGEVDYMKLGR